MRFTRREFSLVAPVDRVPFLHNARILLPSASVTTHAQSSGIGSCAADESEHRKNLEKRLQAQLKDGSRSKDVKRLGDPLVKHLLRVAGNPSYRDTRQSIIVTGKTLICELMSRFPCKRLAVRRQGLAALQSFFGKRKPSSPACRMEASVLVDKTANQHDQQLRKSSLLDTASPLTLDVETHHVSNRILRKVAGLHSYDDGCIAEMRMPEPSTDLGKIRLLLCLGHLPAAFEPPVSTGTSGAASCASGSIECGAVGTLLRTAAALQWQGAWILPSCPDVFSPLAIRASQVRHCTPLRGKGLKNSGLATTEAHDHRRSYDWACVQGALFWLPYRRGRLEELVQFCRAENLAICAPHPQGIPVTAAGIFENQRKSGVCLVLDSSFMGPSDDCNAASAERRKASYVVSDLYKASPSRKSAAKKCHCEPDLCLSLGGVSPDSSMELLHPVSVASLLLYHVKQMHFPTLRGSPFIFSPSQGI
ncbi:hypothetical protein ACSSS7_006504 [Eimeria intestinalis]